MKKLIFTLLLLAPFTASAAPGTVIPPHISVTGVAEKQVVPDTMQWELQINTKGNSVQEAATGHLNDVSGVLTLLKELGVKKADTATSQMQIHENWVYHKESRIVDGYTAGTRISFTIKNFKLYVPLWTKLAAFKNLQISGVNFTLSTRQKLQQELQTRALLAAKAKAKKLAATLGCTVGAPLAIEEGSGQVSPVAVNRLVSAPMTKEVGSRGAVAPGEQRVRSAIHAVFFLKTKKNGK